MMEAVQEGTPVPSDRSGQGEPPGSSRVKQEAGVVDSEQTLLCGEAGKTADTDIGQRDCDRTVKTEPKVEDIACEPPHSPRGTVPAVQKFPTLTTNITTTTSSPQTAAGQALTTPQANILYIITPLPAPVLVLTDSVKSDGSVCVNKFNNASISPATQGKRKDEGRGHASLLKQRTKRCRKRNFTQEETCVLLSGIMKYRHVLKPRTFKNKEKARYWGKILHHLNQSGASSVQRTVDEIKIKWAHIKQDVMESKCPANSSVHVTSIVADRVREILSATTTDDLDTEGQQKGDDRGNTSTMNGCAGPTTLLGSLSDSSGDQTSTHSARSSDIEYINECDMKHDVEVKESDEDVCADNLDTSSEKRKKTRFRKQNFNEYETSVLLSGIMKYREIILDLGITEKDVQRKIECWEKILHHLHQSGASSVNRTVEEIKKKWGNMRCDVMESKCPAASIVSDKVRDILSATTTDDFDTVAFSERQQKGDDGGNTSTINSCAGPTTLLGSPFDSSGNQTSTYSARSSDNEHVDECEMVYDVKVKESDEDICADNLDASSDSESERQKKRHRLQNFNERETSALLSGIMKYREVLDPGTTIQQKNEIWKKILHHFNQFVASSERRTVGEIRMIWGKMKLGKDAKTIQHVMESKCPINSSGASIVADSGWEKILGVTTTDDLDTDTTEGQQKGCYDGSTSVVNGCAGPTTLRGSQSDSSGDQAISFSNIKTMVEDAFEIELGAKEGDEDLCADNHDASTEKRKKTRNRKQNFNEEETSVLLSGIMKYRGVLLEPGKDKGKNERKALYWGKILHQLNQSGASSVRRTVEELRMKWGQIKRDSVESKCPANNSSASIVAHKVREILSATVTDDIDTDDIDSEGYQKGGHDDSTLAVNGCAGPTTLFESQSDSSAEQTSSFSNIRTMGRNAFDMEHDAKESDEDVCSDNFDASTEKRNKKRNRKQNFNEKEIYVLLSGIVKYRGILLDPGITKGKNERKALYWGKILHQLNQSGASSVRRTVEELRMKWGQIKRDSVANSSSASIVAHKVQEILSASATDDIDTDDIDSEGYQKGGHGDSTLAVNSCAGPTTLFESQSDSSAEQTSSFSNIRTMDTHTFSMEHDAKGSDEDAFSDNFDASKEKCLYNKKRNRKKNFNEEETSVLLSEVRKYQHIILEPGKSKEELQQKAECWGKILHQVNQSGASERRTVHEIKNKWSQLKNDAMESKYPANSSSARKVREILSVMTSDDMNTDYSKGHQGVSIWAVNDYAGPTQALGYQSDTNGDQTTSSRNSNDQCNTDGYQRVKMDFTSLSTSASFQPQSLEGDKFSQDDCGKDQGDSFSQEEVSLLLQQVRQHHKILNSTLPTNNTIHLKQRCWQMITAKINHMLCKAGSKGRAPKTWQAVRSTFLALQAERKQTLKELKGEQSEGKQMLDKQTTGTSGCKGRKEDMSPEAEQHMDSLLSLCQHLQRLGLEVGVVVRSSNAVRSWGSVRGVKEQLSEEDQAGSHGDCGQGWRVTPLVAHGNDGFKDHAAQPAPQAVSTVLGDSTDICCHGNDGFKDPAAQPAHQAVSTVLGDSTDICCHGNDGFKDPAAQPAHQAVSTVLGDSTDICCHGNDGFKDPAAQPAHQAVSTVLGDSTDICCHGNDGFKDHAAQPAHQAVSTVLGDSTDICCHGNDGFKDHAAQPAHQAVSTVLGDSTDICCHDDGLESTGQEDHADSVDLGCLGDDLDLTDQDAVCLSSSNLVCLDDDLMEALMHPIVASNTEDRERHKDLNPGHQHMEGVAGTVSCPQWRLSGGGGVSPHIEPTTFTPASPTPADQGRYPCQQCSRVYRRPANLTAHVNRTHTPKACLDCKHCERAFCDRRALQNMQKNKCRSRRRNITLGTNFVCEVCGKTFGLKANLKGHLQIHKEEKNMACPHCPFRCFRPTTLREHIRKHTGERPYLCSVCGKGFVRGNQLNCHMRWHTGERPYVCQDCSKAFRTSEELNIHRRSHTGIHPYVCKFCSKPLQDLSGLKSHLRIHTGERPFKCSICGATFARSDALVDHRRRLHRFHSTDGESSQQSNPSSLSETSPNPSLT